MAGKKEAKKYKAPGLLSSLLALPTENLPQNSGGLLTQYTPSLREKIGNAIYDKARSVGLLNAQNMRVNAQSAVDFVPGVGDAVGFNEAGRDIQAGNYGAGIAGLGLAGVGLIPGAGDMAQKLGKKALANAPEGIRGFHGSPVAKKIDALKPSKGGELGPGVYLSYDEDYAKGFKRDGDISPDEGLLELNIKGGMREIDRKEWLARRAQLMDEARAKNGGEWDSRFFTEAQDQLKEEMKSGGFVGIYDKAGRQGVVFPEYADLVEIVRKYGIAGAIGAGLITHEMGQQMQDQGLL